MNRKQANHQFDVIVVGSGHAGIEAALASARMGAKTACVTLDVKRIGHLPCNCSIGGPAKGHIAREVDALGGQMGIIADAAMTHIRAVGTGKGPAVHTVRAHVCKKLYPKLMAEALAKEPNLTLIEGVAERIVTDNYEASGLYITIGSEVRQVLAKAIVLTTGTFLNGLCHRGSEKTVAARHGDPAVTGLAANLREIGTVIRRFKTGTTPRVSLKSLQLENLVTLESQPEAGTISFLGRRFSTRPLYDCWQTHTNADTHRLLREHLHESPMFSGQIEGIGPRYCPSVEDKVVRFEGKDHHPIFLEIEEWDGDSVYVQGFSTSMPAEVQLKALRTIEGMHNVEVLRYGYAVEYDMADPTQLLPTLESKLLPGLFLAGQINGTSGYEEAAGQGILAGINAALRAADKDGIVLGRDQAFIGVMIDDLVTKGVEDPYRMLTARAEHRLLLRHDNADARLTPIAKSLGLCSEERWRRFEAKSNRIETGINLLNSITTSAKDSQEFESRGWSIPANRVSLFDLLRRPKLTFQEVLDFASNLGQHVSLPIEDELTAEVIEQIELAAKYEGYLQIQNRVADAARKLDSISIPTELSYEEIRGLSYESREKLSRVRPSTLGQASRVPGVRPTDIALLGAWIRAGKRAS